MGLTVTEALAVNRLLSHLGIEPPGEQLIGREQAPAHRLMEDVVLLADHAYRTLSAGRRGEDVRRAWPQVIQALEAGREALGWGTTQADP